VNRFAWLCAFLLLSNGVKSRATAAMLPYSTDPSAHQRSCQEIFNRCGSPASTLTADQAAARRHTIEFYRNLGLDVSLDNEHPFSQLLQDKYPRHWSTQTPQPLSGDFAQPYSVDAPWNIAIPRDWPRLALPVDYVRRLQLTSPNSRKYPGGDGVGMGIVISGPRDPIKSIAGAWTGRPVESVVRMHIRPDVADYLSQLKAGDQQLVLIDSTDNTCVCAYEFRAPGDPRGTTIASNEQFKKEGLRAGYDYRALAIGAKHRLDGIGAEGRCGSIAAGFSQLGFLLKNGESIDPNRPIPHALDCAGGKLMKARVYPAVQFDWTIDTFPNAVGCVPYCGLMQLDPAIDLQSLYQSRKLSLPAFRILQAMQKYGVYQVDTTGPADNMDCLIYTAEPAAEFANITPPCMKWPGAYAVQEELKKFFNSDPFFGLSSPPRMYLVAPLVQIQR
jgi:hypothetical protein